MTEVRFCRPFATEARDDDAAAHPDPAGFADRDREVERLLRALDVDACPFDEPVEQGPVLGLDLGRSLFRTPGSRDPGYVLVGQLLDGPSDGFSHNSSCLPCATAQCRRASAGLHHGGQASGKVEMEVVLQVLLLDQPFRARHRERDGPASGEDLVED